MNHIKKIIGAAFLLAISSLYAGFLVDENPEPAKVNPVTSGSVTQSVGFPVNTAVNITVTPLEGIPNSVRIAWELSAGSDDVFIVGRSTQLADNAKTALEALSIRMVAAGPTNAIIDRNIPNGTYYYVVLSKKRSAAKDIDLYPNENYTTNPIIIGENVPAKKSAPPQVKGLTADLVGEKSVLLMWKPLDFVGVTYSVYRSLEPMSTPDRLIAGEKIAELYDRERFIDKTAVPGRVYFYAVTTKDNSGEEDQLLVPNESYTTNGINIVKTDSAKVVSELKAVPNDRGGIQLSWKAIPLFEGEYLIYRAPNMISSSEALAGAELAGSVLSTQQEYLDKKSGYGDIYYAVVAKDLSGRTIPEFYAGYNYTRLPVPMRMPEDPVKLRVIKAEVQNNTVAITWKYGGSMQRDYLLYRSEKMPQNLNDVSDSYLVDTIDLTRNSFRDTNIPDGIYFYILVPENYLEDKSFILRKGINYTAVPVEIKSVSFDTILKVRTISASSGDNPGEIKILWKASGSEGSNSYSLVRLLSVPRTREEVASGTLVDVVDINSGSFVDKPGEDGSYYYALVPEDYLRMDDLKLIKGENITGSPVIPAQKAREGEVEIVKPEVVTPKAEEIVPKTDVLIPEPDVVPQKEPEKEIVKPEPKKAEPEYVSGDVDTILKKYFYKKKYDKAIKELRRLAKSSDERESARALFYAGRAYVEKGDYNTALNYFLNKKVRSNFQRQSDFWKDYCIKRMKNK